MGSGNALKRSGDVAASLIALVVTSPLLLMCALLIALASPGPILFHQERVGLHGRRFRIHKFRTMAVNAETTGPSITSGDDPRLTAIGRALRRVKFDELPQFYNVLVGEMSLVGPRPEIAHYVDRYPEPARDDVLSVRPGITDLASLRYIDEAGLLARVPDAEQYYVDVLIPAKLELAVAYVRNRSLWLDVRIVAATLTGILGWHWMPSHAPIR